MSQRQAYAAVTQSIHEATQSNIYLLLFVLAFTLVVIYALGVQKKYSGTGNAGNEEHYIGNVGGAGMLDVSTSDSHKQRGCYSDFDCPDETMCNDVGLCVPRIHTLPRSRHTLQMGRGREKEKPTTNT